MRILFFTSLSETFYVPSAKELSRSFYIQDAYTEHWGDIMGMTEASTFMTSGTDGYDFNINMSIVQQCDTLDQKHA